MNTPREQLEIEAMRALYGANNVRRQLLAGLALGSPSIESLVYLTKCRIKDHGRLVNKVLDRRQNGKPTYRARDVTDIVGLRLLTLYRNQLPAVIWALLDYVKYAQQKPLLLFAGTSLDEAVKEVFIYRRSSAPDTIDEMLLRQFIDVGFDYVVVPPKARAEDYTQKVKIVCKPSEYSSIHIVAASVSREGKREFPVPVEIQVRTALEDVWGEIDHALKYKTLDLDPKKLTGVSRTYYEIAAEHLTALKGQLDFCSKTADLVYRQVAAIKSERSYSAKQEEVAFPRSVDTHRLISLPLEPGLKKRLRVVVSKMGVLFSKATAGKEIENADEVRKTITGLMWCASELQGCFEEYAKQKSDSASQDKEITYYLKMESALCLYWAARTTRLRLVPLEGVSHNFEAGDEQLEAALQQYFALEKESRFSADAVLAFRVANCFALRGDTGVAREKYRQAFELIGDAYVHSECCMPLQKDHSMRARIPRFYSIALWDVAERIKREGYYTGYPELLIDVRRKHYLEALDVTRSALGLTPKLDDTDSDGHDPSDDVRRTENNILEYAFCYLNSGGSQKELDEREITVGRMKSFVMSIMPNGPENLERPTLADTVRALARHFGDGKLAKAAARRVLELLEEGDGANTDLPTEAYEEMRNDAQAELARIDPPNDKLD